MLRKRLRALQARDASRGIAARGLELRARNVERLAPRLHRGARLGRRALEHPALRGDPGEDALEIGARKVDARRCGRLQLALEECRLVACLGRLLGGEPLDDVGERDQGGGLPRLPLGELAGEAEGGALRLGRGGHALGRAARRRLRASEPLVLRLGLCARELELRVRGLQPVACRGQRASQLVDQQDGIRRRHREAGPRAAALLERRAPAPGVCEVALVLGLRLVDEERALGEGAQLDPLLPRHPRRRSIPVRRGEACKLGSRLRNALFERDGGGGRGCRDRFRGGAGRHPPGHALCQHAARRGGQEGDQQARGGGHGRAGIERR